MSTAVAATISPRGLALLRTFRAAFEALAEHGKAQPHEQALIAESCAAHLRSAWPMAAAAAPAPLETGPVPRVDAPPINGPIHVDLGDGAFYELGKLNGKTTLYLHDSLEHDADVAMTREQAEAFVRDFMDAMGETR